MSDVIPLASERGQALFQSTPPDTVNWQALECAVPQVNAFYCGPAAVVAALSMALPARRQSAAINQATLFDGPVASFLTKAQMAGRAQREWTDGNQRIAVSYAGLSVEEAARILRVYLPQADVRYAADERLDGFVEWLSRAPTQPAILNFLGSHLKLPLGGHFAVIGAYARAEQAALVLDPARHKLGWYWAPAKALFDAMRGQRPRLNRSRGWVDLGNPSP